MTIRYVNKTGMPEALHAACSRMDRERVPGEFSVTELIGPPRIRQLLRTEDVELDSSSGLWALLGMGVNLALDKYAGDTINGPADFVLQPEFKHRIDGVLVVGHPDVVVPSTLTIRDWKVCSAWVWSLGGQKAEWEAQLNSYAYLARRSSSFEREDESVAELPVDPKRLEITMIFRDWSASKVRPDGDYPDHWTKTVSMPLWPDQQAEEFLRNRIRLHREAESVLPDCTDHERWHRPGGVAVMKKGRKRALRVLDDEVEARMWAEQNGEGGLYLERREGKDVRCLSWCPARSVCSHAQSLQQQETQEEA